MTQNERKEWMLSLRECGLTYKEIGEVTGTSKQRVFQLIGKIDKARFKPITEELCIYDGLRNWMNENRVSRAEFTRMMWGSLHQVNHQRLREWLKGKGMTMYSINKILTTTGLTYEEAFLGGNNNEKAN
jgi:hypothetical protein